jgi:hypothetical protein
VKPVDYVVLGIAGIIGLVVVMPMIHTMWSDMPYDEGRGKTVGAIVTSLVAILSIYVGSKLKDKNDE